MVQLIGGTLRDVDVEAACAPVIKAEMIAFCGPAVDGDSGVLCGSLGDEEGDSVEDSAFELIRHVACADFKGRRDLNF